MPKSLQTFFMVVVFLLSYTSLGVADAITKNRAMSAATIAEYYVEDDHLRLQLEVGGSDLPAFRNILPDVIYADMGFGETPLTERAAVFFGQDLMVIADGEPLQGQVTKMGPAKRLKRDEITGEVLPLQDEQLETVIAMTFIFPFEQKPTVLGLKPPSNVAPLEMGFVAYHKGVAVNDFRYLIGSGAELNLDWHDPWYSAFANKNLRRQYYAPMSGFIYVEPFEVRKEIIVRPLDIQRWVDLGLEGRETIPVDMQGEILQKVAAFLEQHQPVSIDGKPANGILDRINFLERTLTSSRVIDPPEELTVHSAIIGAIFVYPTTSLPDKVAMDWDLWDERVTTVPVSAVDEAGPLPQYLQSDWSVLEWNNFLKNPTLPTLVAVIPPPSALAKLMLWLRWVFAALALCSLLILVKSKLAKASTVTTPAVSTLGFAVFTAVASMLAQPAAIAQEQVGAIVDGLLHNIYRAFDYREEGDVYDVLDRSVSGDLLTTIYLETKRSLVLANQGGARAKVQSIEVSALETTPLPESSGFTADVTWVVTGSVGHWGHVHQRVNQYQAELDVEAVEGVWKVTALNVLQEERL